MPNDFVAARPRIPIRSDRDCNRLRVHLMRVDYAIVFVSDMERSIAFYRDVFGLPLKFQSPHWTEFSTAGATLALHQSESSAAAPPPNKETPAGRCRPGFSVPSLDAFHQRMLEHHVLCLQPPTPTFGVRIAQYSDPDGLVISVSEPRTQNEPELP